MQRLRLERRSCRVTTPICSRALVSNFCNGSEVPRVPSELNKWRNRPKRFVDSVVLSRAAGFASVRGMPVTLKPHSPLKQKAKPRQAWSTAGQGSSPSASEASSAERDLLPSPREFLQRRGGFNDSLKVKTELALNSVPPPPATNRDATSTAASLTLGSQSARLPTVAPLRLERLGAARKEEPQPAARCASAPAVCFLA